MNFHILNVEWQKISKLKGDTIRTNSIVKKIHNSSLYS